MTAAFAAALVLASCAGADDTGEADEPADNGEETAANSEEPAEAADGDAAAHSGALT